MRQINEPIKFVKNNNYLSGLCYKINNIDKENKILEKVFMIYELCDDFDKFNLNILLNLLSYTNFKIDATFSSYCNINLSDAYFFCDNNGDDIIYINQEELKYLMTHEPRMKFLSKMLMRIKDTGNTLILVDRLAAGEMLQKLIPDSVFIQGEMKLAERKEEYDQISSSTNKVLIATYGVASVGINIPRIFNLVLIEPGKSFVRVIQSIGRGIRKAQDKDFVQIWDITSSCKFAKRHLTQRKKFYKEANYPFTMEKMEWN